jgi:hypothetical protein
MLYYTKLKNTNAIYKPNLVQIKLTKYNKAFDYFEPKRLSVSWG